MKKLPVIAIIGKPNAGKSTLINRLCDNIEAIVHKEPMITRDRKYYKTEWSGIYFNILDTGGIDIKNDTKLSKQIFLQSKTAINESDLVILLVDIKSPLSVLDEEIADILRKSQKPVIFVGNKWDDARSEYFTEDYLRLGLGYPVVISAMHGLNITELLDEIIDRIKKLENQETAEIPAVNNNGNYPKDDRRINSSKTLPGNDEDAIPSISILGQPNVGKSTLFNKILKEERVIVDDVEGTTRDSIDSIVTINDRHYRFIDTAGMKKDKMKEDDLEFYSKLRTLRSIEKSDLSLVLIDSTRAITNQDQKIVETCLKKGTSVCVIFNKTDIADKEKLDFLMQSFDITMDYIDYIPFLKISALKDAHTVKIFEIIDYLLKERQKKISDNKLMRLFKDIENESAVYVKSKKFKIKFIKQIRISPPGFMVFSNMDVRKKTNIIKFIENNLRDKFGFEGAPIFFKFKY